jgi:hypothetical protein
MFINTTQRPRNKEFFNKNRKEDFFFEKKKQKTFAPLREVVSTSRGAPYSVSAAMR